MGLAAPFRFQDLDQSPCSTTNSRESPLGAVANKGRSKPLATIWVVSGGTAADTRLAKPAANKVGKKFFHDSSLVRVYEGLSVIGEGAPASVLLTITVPGAHRLSLCHRAKDWGM